MSERTPSPQSVVVPVEPEGVEIDGYALSQYGASAFKVASDQGHNQHGAINAAYREMVRLAAAPAPSSLAGGAVVSDARKITAAAKAICHLFVGHGGDPWTKRSAEDRAHFREEASQVVAALAALSPEAPAREGDRFVSIEVERMESCLKDLRPADNKNTGAATAYNYLLSMTRLAALTPRHEAPASEGDA